jgi:hypothetical protein
MPVYPAAAARSAALQVSIWSVSAFWKAGFILLAILAS